MGGRIFHVGPLGRASELKVITNMLAFVHLVAGGEALMLARGRARPGAGVRGDRASSGTSFVHETEGQVILNGSYDIGFTLDLALKDLGLALSSATRPACRSRSPTWSRRHSPRRVSDTAAGVVADGGEAARRCSRRELRAPGFPASLV